MAKVRTVNDNLELLTIDDIVNHKKISDDLLRKDLNNLNRYDGLENANNFAGNPFLYHYQFANLLYCTRERSGKPRETLYEIWADPELKAHLIEQTRKRNRGGKVPANNVFECFRINTGSIVMFKAVTAKYLYKKYGATKVLDPTAGWGGRMLGAWSLGIDYVGIDTNDEMKPAYDDMMDFLANKAGEFGNGLFESDNTSQLEMIWDSCLNVDFSKINYDFVLTSPPYSNMELYRKMTPWATDTIFYETFLIPMWEKCCKHIIKGGKVAINMSPKMYDDSVKLGLKPCDAEEDLLQQMGQAKGKKKQDKIYIWNC
jgi:hypothetical protein